MPELDAEQNSSYEFGYYNTLSRQDDSIKLSSSQIYGPTQNGLNLEGIQIIDDFESEFSESATQVQVFDKYQTASTNASEAA